MKLFKLQLNFSVLFSFISCLIYFSFHLPYYLPSILFGYVFFCTLSYICILSDLFLHFILHDVHVDTDKLIWVRMGGHISVSTISFHIWYVWSVMFHLVCFLLVNWLGMESAEPRLEVNTSEQVSHCWLKSLFRWKIYLNSKLVPLWGICGPCWLRQWLITSPPPQLVWVLICKHWNFFLFFFLSLTTKG